MSTYGLGLGTAPAPGAPTAEHLLIEQKLRAESSLKGGASWFIWIAGLSVVNSIAAYSGSGWGFAAGLGITQVVDAIARQLGAAGLFLGMAINVMAVAFFVLLWVFGRKAHKWPFMIGLVFYGLDSLLIVAIGLWFGLIIHALGLMGMVRGLKASSELKQLTEAQQTAAAGATATPIG